VLTDEEYTELVALRDDLEAHKRRGEFFRGPAGLRYVKKIIQQLSLEALA
jgi:hypothetical protein